MSRLLSKPQPLRWVAVWFWCGPEGLSSKAFTRFCKKCGLFQQAAFSFGFRSRWPLPPSGFQCAGPAKPPPRDPPLLARLRIYGANAPPARRLLGTSQARLQTSLEDSVGASVISLAPTFSKVRVRSFCCPPFRIGPAAPGCGLVFRICCFLTFFLDFTHKIR